MSGVQSRENGLAELGVRSVTLTVDASFAHAAAQLETDASTLERVVTAARRDGQATEAAAGLCATRTDAGVVVFSTVALRADALAWAGVAHELRNALTTIAGWAQVAAESGDAARVSRAIEMVQTSAREAMDVAPLLLEPRAIGESADVSRVVRQVVERFAPIAASRKVALACRRIDEGDVETSRAALASIVANLVKNAIEACEPGGRVDVGTRTTTRGVEIVVEDDGRGMSVEALRDLFGPRVVHRDGPQAGRGIGLSVVRALVTRAGGTARATSRVGAGSCVRVELPKATRRVSISGVRERAAGRRVLVVDDHAALADLIASTLEARGATVVVTSNPSHAVAAAEEERFDVALVDLDLGDEVVGERSGAALVRTLVATRLARRVIVMSGASAVPDLGADGLLRKPFDLADVEEVALESTRVGSPKRRVR